MHLVDLSHTISTGMDQWPGDEQPLVLHRQSEHGPDSHMSSSLAMGCHVGTHIDAPLHFAAGTSGVDTLPLAHFIGPGCIVDVTGAEPDSALPAEVLAGHDLTGVSFVVFRTGWSSHWGTSRYYHQWPYLSAPLAEALAQAGLRGVGLDTPSLDPYGGSRAHDICAAAGMINIENLTNLETLAGRDFLLLVLPLKLDRTEASPVRAVAWLDNVPDANRSTE